VKRLLFRAKLIWLFIRLGVVRTDGYDNGICDEMAGVFNDIRWDIFVGEGRNCLCGLLCQSGFCYFFSKQWIVLQ
jgi:hypothetical protein